jgi:enediyne biosynthesis protein E4
MNQSIGLLAGPILFCLAFAMVRAAEPVASSVQLADATARSGITFRHTHGGSGQQYIIEFMVGGLATFDYDGDRQIDVFLLNGAPLRGTKADMAPRDGLYRNNGDGTFTDVTEQAGVGDLNHGLGVASADYDNDGDQDLYLSNFGPNVLYRNNGDGTFSDVTQVAGAGRGQRFGAGVGFLDLESDGDLDLYVGNYVDFSYQRHDALAPTSFPFPPGPQDYDPVADNVFRNNGDGTFTDVSAERLPAGLVGPTMGLVCGDFDDDGDADVFLCNDAAPNFLLANDGQGRFTEQAVVAGVAYDALGQALGNMGVDCADYNNDGRLDLFVTEYTAQLPLLLRNRGRGLFDDVTRLTQAGAKAFPHVKWGTALVDLDNDGDRDLFLANGHFLAKIRQTDGRTDFRVANTLCLNQGGKTFVDVSDRCGDGLAPVESSRGVAFDDLDNDGDLDGVVLNVNARPTVLENHSKTNHHWAQMLLVGKQSNRDGVGARVRVVAGGQQQVAEVHSGRSYQSHFGTRLHFGLGTASHVERVEIRWPSGRSEVFSGPAADQLSVLTEGSGQMIDHPGTTHPGIQGK